MKFTKATKHQSRCRLALIGGPGVGKTFSSLRIAHGFGGKIALIDSERNSASKYAGEKNPDGGTFEFDHLSLDSFHPNTYIEAIDAAGVAGYDVLIVDSLSHAWMGKDGALELVDKAAARAQSGSGNKFTAWREVTPLHNRLIDSILQSPCHVIVTMRAKTEYVLDAVERNGRTVQVPRKVGMAPIQRDGLEFEFDLVADMDQENNLCVSKSRCPSLSKQVFKEAGKDVALILKQWLGEGVPVKAPLETLRENLAAASITEAAIMESLRGWKKVGDDIPSLEFVPSTVIKAVVDNWDKTLALLKK